MSPDDDTAPDEHKRKLAGAFSRAAPGDDAVPFFHAFGARLVAVADIQPGTRVLDVACGRGAVLFPAAAAVS